MSSALAAVDAGGRGSAVAPWVRALGNIAALTKRSNATLPGLLDELAERFGDSPALESERECLSYRALAARRDRYAAWAAQAGVRRGDVVGLLMPNCAEYAAIWMGIGHAGAATALINTSLAGDALVHVVAASGCRHIIVAAALAARLDAVRAHLPAGLQVWLHGAHGAPPWDWHSLDVAHFDAGRFGGAPAAGGRPRDTALLIFTSGTTGLPKAAKLSHGKILEWSFWFAGMLDAGPADRLYDCLPLYHSTGGVASLGAVLTRGGTVVVRERFSARRFWDDIAEQDCTLFLYIGELCRYLVNAPTHARERAHRLRLACGNGLRADVWQDMQARFGIPRILEFYASTEGNVSLYNCEGRPGAIGRVPSFLAHRFPVALIRCDPETGDIARGSDGFCVKCAVDEPGEAIGRIDLDDASPQGFEGYTDPAATDKKILRGVFAAGDAWFRTGDLMRRDAAGFYYFLDRLGDTFRWRGENVSTTEVADVICRCPGVGNAVVYGVRVPGAEGRAGMAAIAVAEDFSLLHLHTHLARHLPPYARPMFLRLRADLATTGTFKPIKQALMREGFDTDIVTDALYFDDPLTGGYRRMDSTLHGDIVERRLAV
ncbi:MAG TPA: long-chain-acyl-CoA synthetase [Acetobacteraceae bacterium]|nr:long-chain-acyl-CoA synthetase [Acetobacteraceae bacterium]